jgi:hypothetical protein
MPWFTLAQVLSALYSEIKQTGEIQISYRGEDVDCDLLGCEAVWTYRWKG